MLALWIDQMAVGDHTTTGASLTFTGMAGKTATGFDVISGVRQQLRSVDNGADLVVSDLLIGDGPFFVRLEG